MRLGLIGPALAAIVLLGAASQFWVVDLQTGTYTLLAFYLPLAVLAALVAELDPERLPVAGAVVLQVGLAVLFALVGIYQWATETIWWNDLLETANRYTSSFRVNSLFISPAPFGRFEALALITIVALLALGPPRRAIVALAPAGPLLLVGLALSYSRTAMVAMVAGLVVLSLVVWRRPAAIALGIGAVAAIVLALALPQTRDAFSGGGEKLVVQPPVAERARLRGVQGAAAARRRPRRLRGGLAAAGGARRAAATARTTSCSRPRRSSASSASPPWPRCSPPPCTPRSGRATGAGGACCGWWWRSSSA